MAARKAKEEKLKKAVQLKEHGITEEEENLVKSIKFGKSKASNSGGSVVRLNEEDERIEEERRRKEVERIQMQQRELKRVASTANQSSMPVIKVKRKKALTEDAKQAKKVKQEPPVNTCTTSSLAGLLGGYGSDSDSD